MPKFVNQGAFAVARSKKEDIPLANGMSTFFLLDNIF